MQLVYDMNHSIGLTRLISGGLGELAMLLFYSTLVPFECFVLIFQGNWDYLFKPFYISN